MAGKAVGHNDFTPDEIDRGLTALALCQGNSERAVKLLKEDTTMQRVPTSRAIRLWRDAHATRYREILDERAPHIEASAIHDWRAIVARTNQVHLQAVERTADGINDLDAKDASTAAKNLAIAGGVAADKLLVFTDRPNIIHSRPDPEQTLTGLMRALGIPRADTIPGTATDLPSDALLPGSSIANVRET